jgi:hypothetical protein
MAKDKDPLTEMLESLPGAYKGTGGVWQWKSPPRSGLTPEEVAKKLLKHADGYTGADGRQYKKKPLKRG